LKITETKIPGAIVLDPRVFGDERGFFMETWHQARYEEAGLPARFVQDNLSFSQRGVLRGLHFQNPDQQGKLVQVLQGEVFDVAVDIRVGSPTFGQWEAVLLSSENKRQFYVPDQVAFLRKMVALTTGKVIVSFPGHSVLREPARRLRYKLTGKGDIYLYSREDVERIATEAGLRDKEIIYIPSSGGSFVLVGRRMTG